VGEGTFSTMPRDDDEPDGSERPDEDAPGNFVDDEEAESVPEPNEPA
jgi:hypothetical protein